MSFRGKDGRFSASVNLTYQDLRRTMRRTPGDHWLPNEGAFHIPAQHNPWRIRVAKYPFLQDLFSTDARPTVRIALWAHHHRRVPKRLRSLCKVPGCVNPDHHEEITVTPDEVYKVFFQQAYERAEAGNPLRVEFTSEGDATRYRQRLNAFRRRGLDDLSLPQSWGSLALRLLEPEKPDGPWTLMAVIPSEDLESALANALGVADLSTLAEEPSALDLIKGDLE